MSAVEGADTTAAAIQARLDGYRDRAEANWPTSHDVLDLTAALRAVLDECDTFDSGPYGQALDNIIAIIAEHIGVTNAD